jgi:hypothetical protein
MRVTLIAVVVLAGLNAGCAAPSATKPVEMLDERTGMTLAALEEPIELLPTTQTAALSFGKRTSFAYLGPVEWNRMGTIAYGLWVHIAPGSERQTGDIRLPAAVTLILDDGPLDLAVIEVPALGRAPYKQVVSWGQTAYFDLTVDSLKRMAASHKLELDVRAANDSVVSFFSSQDTHATLAAYLEGRGITGD